MRAINADSTRIKFPEMSFQRSSSIAIIGAGSVGAAVSNALLLKGVCSELIMVDIDQERCKGEVADLQDGSFLTNTRVKVGTAQEAGQADIIVITSGAKQKIGETRLQLIERNFYILKSVIEGMQPMKKSAIIIVVANPCDVLTYFAQKLSRLPLGQVFGSGTFLDTARLRTDIANRLDVAYTAVHAYVLGEHGDSQFVAWSSASIGCMNLMKAFPEFQDEQIRNDIALKTRNKAGEIIKAKGATYFGIAAVVSSICETIMMDRKNVRPVSVHIPEWKICISYPVVLGRNGVLRVLPIELDESEMAKMAESAKHLRTVINDYEPKLDH